MQRRHQKWLKQPPAPALPLMIRKNIGGERCANVCIEIGLLRRGYRLNHPSMKMA